MKKFVKGQKAWVHGRDERHEDYETTVVSVGKKYITCKENPSYRGQRFDIDDLIDIDWSNWVLYHSKEECEHMNTMGLMRKEIIRNIDKLLGSMSEDELKGLYKRLKEL